MARRTDLHYRPNTFAQTCLLALNFSLQSGGGPYIPVQVVLPLDRTDFAQIGGHIRVYHYHRFNVPEANFWTVVAVRFLLACVVPVCWLTESTSALS